MTYPKVVLALARRAKTSKYHRDVLIIMSLRHESRGIRESARDLIDDLLYGYYDSSPDQGVDPDWVTELRASQAERKDEALPVQYFA